MSKKECCKCKSGCTNRRCACLKNNRACNDSCSCRNCKNPFNGMDLEGLSICATQNIQAYKKLSPKELDALESLPCEEANVPLRELLKGYECSDCGETYWYSFCWNAVVQDGDSWHCEICNECRDWREWHCDNCNKCTYGVTSGCEHCGAAGEMADFF